MSRQAEKKSAAPVLPAAAQCEPVLTAEQVAERLQIKVATVRELTRRRCRRPLPYVKAGKYKRFRWGDIEKWLAESGNAAKGRVA